MTQHILVVEDEESLQAFLVLHLENEGYRVTAVGTGGGMRKVLASESVDLIVLDLGLPDGDGLTIVQQLRETSSVPVIVATARKGQDDRLMALGLGADDYVTKPFDLRELQLRVRNVLRRTTDHGEEVAADRPRPSVAARPAQMVGAPEPPSPRRRASLWVAMAGAIVAVGTGAAWLLGGFQTPTGPRVEEPPTAGQKAPTPTAKPSESLAGTAAEMLGYGWVADSKCGAIPEVAWWKQTSAEKMVRYVDQKHGGDWQSYIDKWLRQLIKMQDILDRGSTAVTRDGARLRGEALREYINKLEMRVAVTRCLAHEAAQHAKATR